MPGIVQIAGGELHGNAKLHVASQRLRGADDVEHALPAAAGRNGERAARNNRRRHRHIAALRDGQRGQRQRDAQQRSSFSADHSEFPEL